VFAGVVNVPPYDTVVGDDGALPEPPPAAYVIVCVFAVHVAVNVTLPLTVPDAGYVAEAAYVEEPSLHPANV